MITDVQISIPSAGIDFAYARGPKFVWDSHASLDNTQSYRPAYAYCCEKCGEIWCRYTGFVQYTHWVFLTKRCRTCGDGVFFLENHFRFLQHSTYPCSILKYLLSCDNLIDNKLFC